MELIRAILLKVEEDAFAYGQRVRIDGVDDVVCGKHVALIIDAGLAVGVVHRCDAYGITGGSIDRLTASGHDFCDGIRNEGIWAQVQERVLKPGAGYGLSVLVEYVRVEVHRRIFGDHQ